MGTTVSNSEAQNKREEQSRRRKELNKLSSAKSASVLNVNQDTSDINAVSHGQRLNVTVPQNKYNNVLSPNQNNINNHQAQRREQKINPQNQVLQMDEENSYIKIIVSEKSGLSRSQSRDKLQNQQKQSNVIDQHHRNAQPYGRIKDKSTEKKNQKQTELTNKHQQQKYILKQQEDQQKYKQKTNQQAERKIQELQKRRREQQESDECHLFGNSSTHKFKQGKEAKEEEQVKQHMNQEHSDIPIKLASFNQFDWEIPREVPKTNQQKNKLKPENSVVLTNKFAEQSNDSEQDIKTMKKKNRRDLMNEVISGRRNSIGDDFKLTNLCMPKQENDYFPQTICPSR